MSDGCVSLIEDSPCELVSDETEDWCGEGDWYTCPMMFPCCLFEEDVDADGYWYSNCWANGSGPCSVPDPSIV